MKNEVEQQAEFDQFKELIIELDKLYNAMQESHFFHMFNGIVKRSSERYNCTYALKAISFLKDADEHNTLITKIKEFNRFYERYKTQRPAV